jgi:hypothetical protein
MNEKIRFIISVPKEIEDSFSDEITIFIEDFFEGESITIEKEES